MALIILSEEVTKIGWMMSMLKTHFDSMVEVHHDHLTKEVTYRVKKDNIPDDDQLVKVTIFQKSANESEFEIKVDV